MIYAIPDIHGCYKELKQRIKQLKSFGFFDPKNNDTLVFLGDYIDRGPKSLETILYVKELNEKFPNKIIALKGNHEDDFLLSLNCDNWQLSLETWDTGSLEDFDNIESFSSEYADDIKKMNSKLAKVVIESYPDLIRWIERLPYYYETRNQIFVHACVDEDAGENWKVKDTDFEFFDTYVTLRLGKFYKTVIAGHFNTSFIANNPDFNEIYHDGESHYYVDGGVTITGNLNMLCFDDTTNKYYSVLSNGKMIEIQSQ